MAIGTGTALAIGAGLGLLKGVEAQNQASAERDRQAAVARYSPWTGMQAKSVSSPSMLGNIATGTAMGAMATKMFPAAGGAAGALDAGTNANIDKVLADDIALGNASQAAAGGAGGEFLSSAATEGQPSSWFSLMNKNQQQPFSLYGSK